MTAHNPLPESLDPAGFTVADARWAGVRYSRLRAQDLGAPYPGVRRAAGLPLTFEARCRLVLSRLGDGVFLSHTSAAQLWRMHLDTPALVDVSVVAPRRAPHAGGIHGHAIRLAPSDVSRRFGLPMTSPVRTWLDLAAAGESIENLVVAADRIVHAHDPLASIDDLGRAVERHRGRGIRSLHQALPLVSDRSDSGRETRVRSAILGRGLPSPIAQHRVLDHAGRLIGIADLAFPEYRTLLEYEGDHHRTGRVQWGRDLARFNRYQRAGWIALRVEAGQFTSMSETLDTLEAALQLRGWRPTE